MTLEEAVQALADCYPDRTVFVTRDITSHMHKGKRGKPEDAFRVAIVPGLPGDTACSSTRGPDLAAAVAEMVAREASVFKAGDVVECVDESGFQKLIQKGCLYDVAGLDNGLVILHQVGDMPFKQSRFRRISRNADGGRADNPNSERAKEAAAETNSDD